ncbi:MAG TPA: phage terminase large subunit [Patescibacteria group bacterium]
MITIDDESVQATQAQVNEIIFRCKEDLKFLCKMILGYKDWSANPELHRAIAMHIRKPSKYKLFLLPRDHLKSSIITKGGAIMRLCKYPNIRILIANNTWDNARKFLGSITKYLMQGQELPKFFGTFESKQWNQDEITIKQRKVILDAPTIATTGLEKEQTSQHYDLIIADDLVARENVQTSEQRAKVKDYINSLIALLEPNGELWVVGTRWSQDDAYGDLLEEGIWDPLIRSAYTDETRSAPIFPEKFTLEKLQFLRNKLGPTLFSCWFVNDPISQEAADFKKEWVRYYQLGTPHPDNLYLAIDPAHSLGRDADPTAMTVAGKFSTGVIRVVDYFRKKVVPSELIDALFTLVKKWGLRRIGIESWAFQKTLKYEIERKQKENGIYFSIDELTMGRGQYMEPTRNKESRIRSLQPLFEQGLIELRPDMTDLVDELLAFPRGKHDDLIDCLSRTTNFLIPSLGTQPKADEKYMSMDWWVKNHLPAAPTGNIYERYMADLR